MARADRGEAGWRACDLRARAQGRGGSSSQSHPQRRAWAASDFDEKRGRSGWWEWGDAKRVLEWLFWAGHITTATRRGSFERVYDLTERVIPAEILALPSPTKEAQRALINRAATHSASPRPEDLRDDFRLAQRAATGDRDAGRGRRSRAGRGARMGRPRIFAATPAGRAGSRRALSSRRSIRSSGSVPAPAALRLPLPD